MPHPNLRINGMYSNDIHYHPPLVMFTVLMVFYRCLLPQGDEELAIDVMDRLSASVLESFIHLTGADQVHSPTR